MISSTALAAPAFVFATLALGCSPPRAERPRSALLLTLDTTRADALGCYGEPHGVTPNLDRLEAEGVCYRWARTTAPATAPAHASMLTGLYPPRHTVRDNSSSALPSSAVTLAERAREHGLQTAAFVAATVLDRTFGLAQGFEVYDQVSRARQGSGPIYPSRPANEVVDAALAWVRSRDRERPFFLWVHLFDPHQPLRAPEEFIALAGGRPYLAEVAFMDRELGRLLEALREDGALEETLVIALADHGEGLGEHGEDTHGSFCFDSTLRVPLIVRDPSGQRAGERSQELASVADVYPTVVEALALGETGDVDGESLWRRELSEDRGVYFESYYGYLHYGWSPLAGWADRFGKYVHSSDPELFDPARKPKEGQNLLAQAPERAAAYRERIAEVAARAALPAGEALDPALLASVRQLGYTDAGGARGTLPGPLEDTGLPSPHARAEELRRAAEALRAAESGDREGAIARLRELARENPRNSFALEYLGFYLIDAGQPGEAIPVLEGLLAIGPERASTHLNLGYCLQATGQDERAIAQFARVIELDPLHVEGLQNLITVLERNGRGVEAAELRKRLPRAGS